MVGGRVGQRVVCYKVLACKHGLGRELRIRVAYRKVLYNLFDSSFLHHNLISEASLLFRSLILGKLIIFSERRNTRDATLRSNAASAGHNTPYSVGLNSRPVRKALYQTPRVASREDLFFLFRPQETKACVAFNVCYRRWSLKSTTDFETFIAQASGRRRRRNDRRSRSCASWTALVSSCP